jgi:hypothetical protein
VVAPPLHPTIMDLRWRHPVALGRVAAGTP